MKTQVVSWVIRGLHWICLLHSTTGLQYPKRRSTSFNGAKFPGLHFTYLEVVVQLKTGFTTPSQTSTRTSRVKPMCWQHLSYLHSTAFFDMFQLCSISKCIQICFVARVVLIFIVCLPEASFHMFFLSVSPYSFGFPPCECCLGPLLQVSKTAFARGCMCSEDAHYIINTLI